MTTPERTVTSPVGDEIVVYSDDDLIGLMPNVPIRAVVLAASWEPRRGSARGPVLSSLWHDGPAVDRKTGAASAVLRDRALRFGLSPSVTPAQMTTTVNTDLLSLLVERETKAKRTYSIRLVGVAERWLPMLRRQVESDVDAGVDVGLSDVGPALPSLGGLSDAGSAPVSGRGDGAATGVAPAPVEVEIANAVATALLTQVVEIIASGSGAGAQLGRLQLDVEALEARLGTQVAYVDKLRRQVREAGDEVTALRVERDGLRQRLRAAEHNLTVATGADAQRIIDAEVRRQLDIMMRQAPGGERSKIAAVS